MVSIYEHDIKNVIAYGFNYESIRYQEAQVCYAYLSDVSSKANDKVFKAEFSSSQWFKRGWTLQELLAPQTVVFFNRNWIDIGTKRFLQSIISQVTGIFNLQNFSNASVAQKFSWASRRQTTRVEDKAYSLIGLFGINMPLLYGEGKNAFLRLQLEIIKVSNDESIFAWHKHSAWNENLVDETPPLGLLTSDLSLFDDCGDIIVFQNTASERAPYEMTQRGLRIELEIKMAKHFASQDEPALIRYTTKLNCQRRGNLGFPLGILLTYLPTNSKGKNEDQVQRLDYTLIDQDYKDKYFESWWSHIEEMKYKATVYFKQINESEKGLEKPTTVILNTRSIRKKVYGSPSLHYNVSSVDIPCLLDGYAPGFWSFFDDEIILKFRDTYHGREFPVDVLLCGLRRPGGDKFGLFFKINGDHVGIGLLLQRTGGRPMQCIPPDIQSWQTSQELPDRVSGRLTSGASLSVMSKRVFQSGALRFSVELNIHEDGRLEWPMC
jgi:hypothetical protein